METVSNVPYDQQLNFYCYLTSDWGSKLYKSELYLRVSFQNYSMCEILFVFLSFIKMCVKIMSLTGDNFPS